MHCLIRAVLIEVSASQSCCILT